MRVLLALALLVWASTNAHHTPEHNLRGPPFVPNKVQRYELWMNMTSGIPGLTPQLAKSVLRAKVWITPKNEYEHLLKIEDVRVSELQPSVPHDEEEMRLRKATHLETELSKPMKFTLRDGEIETYTLDRSESEESKKIKRGILRHLQFELRDTNDEEYKNTNEMYPYAYNNTRYIPAGNLSAWYVVTVSPYPEFPYEERVFNVSKTEVYEPLGYPAYHIHHNFAKQGCPEVCKMDWNNETNMYGAECPHGYEPHYTPLKVYTTAHYDFAPYKNQMMLEHMYVEEKHIASMYDQDMVVAITSEWTLMDVVDKHIEEPRDGVKYENLEFDVEPDTVTRTELDKEYSYIEEIFPNVQLRDVETKVERILEELVRIVLVSDIETSESQEVGEKLIILQRLLSMLKKPQLENVFKNLVDLRNYKRAPEEKKIKRQIFLEVFPLVGTYESMEFLKMLVEEQKIDIWEAKEMLEAIPENLMKPNEKIIKILYELLEVRQVKSVYPLKFAAHLTLARVIEKACVNSLFINATMPEEEDSQKRRDYSRRLSRMIEKDDDDDDDDDDEMMHPSFHSRRMRSTYGVEYQCPRDMVNKFIREISEKLYATREMKEKVMYIETLAHVASRKVIPYLVPYIYGTAKDVESWAPADIDFLKTVTLYSLHNVIGYYPTEMLKYVTPVYFNYTEVPRVRIAAFSVLIRSQPPLHLLEHIALDTQNEVSNEVGSFVYSTVTALGNSSEPCMQLTARRIKHVISQFKYYDIGHQHSKMLLKTFFDELRNFGVEYKASFTPSNESFVPHSLYGSATYNIHNLKDILWQLAFNIQGVTDEELLKLVDTELLGFRWPKNIPPSKEREIFKSLEILPRLPQELRLTVYRKIFYSPCYMYFDLENMKEIIEPVIEHVRNIFSLERESITGHYIKVFIPSSLHAFSMARTLPVPVEFHLKHPILLSLKIEGKLERTPVGFAMTYKLRPSVYYTAHLAHHVISPVDKKAYGVYHEQKYTMSMPLEFYLHYNPENHTVVFTTHIPELPKRFFRYHSEAGTYAEEIKLNSLPSTDNRDPIRTLPTLFEKEKVIGVETMPLIHLVSHSEDITDYIEEVPRTGEDLVDLIIKYLRNPGWRKKSINATLVRSPNNQVDTFEFVLSFNKTHKFSNRNNVQSTNDWFSNHKISSEEQEDDDDEVERVNVQSENRVSELGLKESEAKKIYENIMYRLPHVEYEFEVKMTTTPAVHKANLRMEYNHTYDRILHAVKTMAYLVKPRERTPMEYTYTHVMKYSNIPNEFEYNPRKYGDQRVDFYSALNLHERKMFGTPEIITQGSFYHVPSEELFDRNEFSNSLRKEWFLPETHEDCIKDVREGNPMTEDCMSAIREETIYNRYHIKTFWNKEIPEVLRNVTYKLDQAIKYAFYGNMDMNRVNVNNPKDTLDIKIDYVNKLVDEPVMNVYVRTPEETVHYHKVEAKYLQPISGLYRNKEFTMNYATNNTYPPTCIVSEKYVKTFDLKNFPIKEDRCKYVISTHCTEHKKFAVLAKRIASSEKEIEIYIEEHLTTLKAPRRGGNEYIIEFNGQKHTVTKDKPILLDRKANIHVYLIPVTSQRQEEYILVFHADGAGIRIFYDGKNLKLQVSPMYKGKLCGLCSEFDGEEVREFRGVNQCVYVDVEDFVHSAIVDSEQCGVSREPKYPVICPDGRRSDRRTSPKSRYDDDDEDNTPYDNDDNREDEDDNDERRSSNQQDNEPTLRNIYLERGENVCFSVKPVPVCLNNETPRETQRKTVQFHCLPKYDAFTRKLIVESERRILRELTNKSVDYTKTMGVAVTCRE